MQCLRVIWLGRWSEEERKELTDGPACVSVLETCLHDDLTGNRGVLLRARALAERLKNYMHAGSSLLLASGETDKVDQEELESPCRCSTSLPWRSCRSACLRHPPSLLTFLLQTIEASLM